MPNQPPLNPDALEAMSRQIDPDWWQIIDNYPDDIATPRYRKTALDKAERYARAYLAAALPEVTSVEELDQLPQGAVIMATGGQWNPDYPELFLKAGYAHAPWLALDPSDRDDGENLESSGAVLKWRCDGSARVLYRPSEQP